ncbi:dTDP-4-dehydrorhamnose reductase [bacterium]|nr:dTDP-4-dehydrorhamnose reductase [bacterium]
MASLKLLRDKILIVGATGLLGQKLVVVFQNGFEVTGIGRREHAPIEADNFNYRVCDMTNRAAVKALVKEIQPQVIINAAAYTNVDGCEDNKEECWRANVTGVENLVAAGRTVRAFLVHISTDYVFDGTDGNYSETSSPNPISYYGRAKLASENAVIASGTEYAVIRTMILYGIGKDLKPNFATWLVSALSKGDSVRIVEDQFGHPTLVDDLALAVRRIVELQKSGIFHVAGAEYVSRYEFTIKLADIFGFDKGLIHRVKTRDLKQKAPRPLNSRFNLEKIHKELGIELSGVEKGLTIFKQQLENSNKSPGDV